MGEQKQRRSFLSAVSNFWYYHKWHLLLGAFIAAVAAVGLSQCVHNVEADLTVGLYFNRQVSSAEADALEKALGGYAEDVNGDGKVIVEVYDFSFKQSGADRQLSETQHTRLTTELSAGGIMLFFTDDYRLREFEGQDLVSGRRLVPQSGGGLYSALEGLPLRDAGVTVFVRKTEGFAVMKRSGAEERLKAAEAAFDKMSRDN